MAGQAHKELIIETDLPDPGNCIRIRISDNGPGIPEEEIPIGHITNGVHIPSWVAHQMTQLYDRHFPVGWQNRMGEPEVWQFIHKCDPGELWETHNALKNNLLSFVRRRVSRQCRRRGENDDIVEAARRATNLPLDVHLMIEQPARYLQEFADAGADYIVVHAEACRHLHRALQMIGDLGKKAGVAFNPATPIEALHNGQNVTATGKESKIWDKNKPETMPDLKSKISD